MNNSKRDFNKKNIIVILVIIAIFTAISLCLANNAGKTESISRTLDVTKFNLGDSKSVEGYSAICVQDLYYSGTESYASGLEEVLSSEKKMYSDQETTFTKVPGIYENAEYLLLPSEDNQFVGKDIIKFVAKRDITVIIMRDETTDRPTWLDSSYIKKENNVIGGNGVTYTIYTNNVVKGTSVTIGSTSDTQEGGAKGVANIVAFKETKLIESGQFFNETFENSDEYTIKNGYNAVINENTNIEIDSTKFAADANHKEVLHFIDDNISAGDSNLAYLEKEFAKLSINFTYKYDIFVPVNNYNNLFLRMFLNKDVMASPSSKTNLAIQSYINKPSNSSINIKITPEGRW